MVNKSTFGQFLRQKRNEKGMTQKEFAEKLFLSESAISKWEQGVSHS
ncbi:MAG: helix-turn-helix transcriptional regulator [Acutalibacteraceae bacterium]|nr:helix-turn-helix transcriptional regulator [Acutalibacteraceae bacterium]